MDVRSKARLAAAAIVIATATAALVAVGACLPDLAAIPSEDASFEAAPPSFRGCGDGIIEAFEDGRDAGESCDPGDADVAGCTSCEITCEGGKLDPKSGHCYFVTGSDDRYDFAVQRCASQRAHVVTLGSSAEVTLVDDLAGGRDYWIDLSKSSSRPGFVPTNPEEPGLPAPPLSGPCTGCFAVGADGGTVPRADVDAQAAFDCIVASDAGWLSAPCSGAPRTTICEREPPGRRASFDCIGGNCFNVVATSGEKVYFVVSSSTDPASAESNCALFDGGSLVVLRSAEEREQLAHEILERAPLEGVPQTYWIGLALDAGTWVWADGVAADGDGGRPLPWGNAQPETAGGASRAYMRLGLDYDTQLAYANDPAGAPRKYVCQRPPF